MRLPVERWGRAPIALITDPKVNHNALKVYIALAAFKGSDEYCWPSRKKIMEWTGITTPNKITDALKILKDTGWIKVTAIYENNVQVGNHYYLLEPVKTTIPTSVHIEHIKEMEERDGAFHLHRETRITESGQEKLLEMSADDILPVHPARAVHPPTGGTGAPAERVTEKNISTEQVLRPQPSLRSGFGTDETRNVFDLIKIELNKRNKKIIINYPAVMSRIKNLLKVIPFAEFNTLIPALFNNPFVVSKGYDLLIMLSTGVINETRKASSDNSGAASGGLEGDSLEKDKAYKNTRVDAGAWSEAAETEMQMKWGERWNE
jgi:hypothetical protein